MPNPTPRGPGRPPKESEAREAFTIRATPENRQRLAALAARWGVTPSDALGAIIQRAFEAPTSPAVAGEE